MRTDPIEGYLQYLAQMSRKITSRGVHTNVLARKTKNTPSRYRSQDSQSLTADKHQAYLKSVHEELARGDGRMVFMCIGLVVGRLSHGEAGRVLSAPLIMIPMEVWQDDQTAEFEWEESWEELSLNYDLLTLLIESQLSPADEEDQAQVSDTLSASIRHCITVVETELGSLAATPNGRRSLLSEGDIPTRLFEVFKRDLLAFRGIKSASTVFDIKQLAKLTASPVQWCNHRFYCMASMPGELSTFRALGSLLREIKAAGGG